MTITLCQQNPLIALCVEIHPVIRLRYIFHERGEAGLPPCIVVAGLDRHCHANLRVYTVDITKNEIKQLVAVVVLVGASPVV